MFNLFRKSQPRHPTIAITQALASHGLPAGVDPATLEVLEHRAAYSGRQVTYFRVFDPARAAEKALQIREFSDLDAHPELILGSGHLEQNGAVIMSKADQVPVAAGFARSEANRADHSEDERFVFPDRAS